MQPNNQPEDSSFGLKFVFSNRVIIPKSFSLDEFMENARTKSSFSIGISLYLKNFRQQYLILRDNAKRMIFYKTEIRKSVSDCLEFIKSQKGLYPSADGLAIAWLLKKSSFPYENSVIGMDETKNLPLIKKPINDKVVPEIYCNYYGMFRFGLISLHGELMPGDFLFFYK